MKKTGSKKSRDTVPLKELILVQEGTKDLVYKSLTDAHARDEIIIHLGYDFFQSFTVPYSEYALNGVMRILSIRGGHRHLQVGRMLDIDLISEPPTPSPTRCRYPKCGNLCCQMGRKLFIAIWGLRMSHIYDKKL